MPPSETPNGPAVIPAPRIDGDVPATVIPTASVAPLDGPPDGERITTFTIAPQDGAAGREPSLGDALEDLRRGVLARPLAAMVAAFSFGLVVGRVLR